MDLDFYLDIKVMRSLECIFCFRLTGYFLRRMALVVRQMRPAPGKRDHKGYIRLRNSWPGQKKEARQIAGLCVC